MHRDVFNYPPTVEVLKLLTPGSLKQNLAKAVRLWVILRSIYGDDLDEVKLKLTEEFTFLAWRDLFFTEATKSHLRDKAPIFHDPKCRCAKKLTEWLFTSNLSIKKNHWCSSFQQYYSIQDDELENLLLTGIINHDSQNSKQSQRFSKSLSDGRLFAVTSRNLKNNDLQSLVNFGCINRTKKSPVSNTISFTS